MQFGRVELDPARRELRIDGVAQSLQPQVFDLLLFLVEQRDRVVTKRELLDALWPEAVVTESSLQRAVSLARTALGDDAALIQTFPRQGYRFVGEVETPHLEKRGAPALLTPRYARSGDVHIAYSTFGDGEEDIVIVNGWIMPMRGMLHHRKPRALIETLAQDARVILFDKRGTGLSDRVKELPSHERRMDDLRAVLEACGSERATVIGMSEGGALAILYAATYPERVRGLVLCGAFARMTSAQGYPHGYAPEAIAQLESYIRGAWGKGASLRAIAPSESSDPEFVQWIAAVEQEGSSPGGALDLLAMNVRIDLRSVLGLVRVPTIVLQAGDDKMIDPKSGRCLANEIRGARYVEVPGDDHLFTLREQSHLLEAVRWIREQHEPEPDDDRFLSTVLAAKADQEVDRDRWLECVARCRGHSRPTSMDAYFDGPVRALQCAAALASALPVSCGVHTGEVIRQGSRVAGEAFSIAEELAAGTPRGEVAASRVVADLVPGSAFSFDAAERTVQSDGRPIGVFSLRLES